MPWVNYGDMKPESGALMLRDIKIGNGGELTAECVETICENTVGGDESRFLIRQGNLFLSAKNFASALDCIGSELDLEQSTGKTLIKTPGHYGDDIYEVIDSADGLAKLAMAAHAYGGIDDIDISVLVQIGKDEIYDADRKFTGDLHVYAAGSSLWSIMEQQLDGFEAPEKVRKARFVKTVEEQASPSPSW